MNGNSKKLAALVMIVAVAMVLPVAMVSADDHAGKKFIQGTWAVTGMNGGLLALSGFDPKTLEPNDGVAFPIGPQSWKGTYTFHKNGTVDWDVIIAGVDPAIPNVPLTESVLHGTGKLYYTLAHGGKITFTAVHGTLKDTPVTRPSDPVIYFDTDGSWDGVISPDGQSMQVTWGPPLILFMTDEHYNPTPTEFIVSGSFTLFRLND